MRCLLCTLLGCFVVIVVHTAFAQERAIGVSVIELMANPEKFNNRVVEVTAFLVIEHQPRHAPQATPMAAPRRCQEYASEWCWSGPE